MRTRLSLQTNGQLVTRNGTVIGCVESITVDLDLAILGDYRGKDVDFLEKKEELSLEGGVGETVTGQTAMLTDPVVETWEHYRLRLGRPRAKLTPKIRRWINDAIEAVGVDRCKRAIEGLAASEHHRLGGYIGIEYALRPKQGQTIEGRISMMEAKLPTDADGQTTVQRLLARLPSETHSTVRSWMAHVESMLQHPEHKGVVATGEGSLADLRSKALMEPVIEDGRLIGWRDLKPGQEN